VTRTVYEVAIDRLSVRGAPELPQSAGELSALVEGELARRLLPSELPSGRTARASVVVTDPRLAGTAADAAGVIATGVLRAMRRDR